MLCPGVSPFPIRKGFRAPSIDIVLQAGHRQANQSRRRCCVPFAGYSSTPQHVNVPDDHRARLSQIWAPSGGLAASQAEDSHSKLLRAGFLRQAHSGIFHLLPLGRRVQDKLEALIDKHMSKLGASRLALSSISSQDLWTKSGRLDSASSEVFRFEDRRAGRYLLAPTHEEEITRLVANAVHSYKELPVRLYQISRKYRDELRPRHGLLRSREFVMKDLYTFDYSVSLALLTYDKVQKAYESIFNELKIPYLVAEADSGNMGGNLSHEFHFPTLKGEDHVISCSHCNYVANEELAVSVVLPKQLSRSSTTLSSSNKRELPNGRDETAESPIRVWRGISSDRLTLVNAWYLSHLPMNSLDEAEINVHALKAAVPALDASVEDPSRLWMDKLASSSTDAAAGENIRPKKLHILNLIDCRVSHDLRLRIESQDPDLPFWPAPLKGPQSGILMTVLSLDSLTGRPFNLLRIRDGDTCPRCLGETLKVQKAIELGHTFHLGTRYSAPLNASVTVPGHFRDDHVEAGSVGMEGATDSSLEVAMQMGCHGIGVSRMIGAVADTLADDKGLNWPRVMAPFEVVIIPARGLESAAQSVYDALSLVSVTSDSPQLDLVLDDRAQSFPWKMQDADLVGYPVIVVVGRRWQEEQMCEVQCRRLQVREDISLKELQRFISSLLVQL